MDLDLPQIDAARCYGCELCVKLCPTQALGLAQGVAVVMAPERCTYAGVCEAVCPVGAISLAYEIVFSGQGKRRGAAAWGDPGRPVWDADR